MSEIFNNDAAETKEVYEAAFDEYARQAKEHARELRAALFGIGEARSTALAQAIDADEDQLMRMDELSEFTGVETIGKAAFAAAVTRGDAPRVVHGYLEKFPENEPLPRLRAGPRRGVDRHPKREHRAHSQAPDRGPAAQPAEREALMMDREKRRLARLEEEAARQGEPVGDGQTRPSYLEEKHALEKPDPEAWFDLMARHGWSREEAEEDLLWDAEVERRCRESGLEGWMIISTR